MGWGSDASPYLYFKQIKRVDENESIRIPLTNFKDFYNPEKSRRVY